MQQDERWLLPDGIEETLPGEARRIEMLRRQALDLLDSWGYQLVMPPLMEYLDSLLTGVGRDLEIETFKLTDQISGKMMGVRADMTPQVARIDAHYLRQSGPTRLCYFGPVLRTRPDFLGASRAPLQLGAELFGVPGTQGDVEIVELLIEVLRVTGLDDLHVDLGHMGIFQQMAEHAGLDPIDRERLHAAVIARSRQDVDALCGSLQIGEPLRQLFVLMADSSGSVDGLEGLRDRFADAPEPVLAAFDNLREIALLLRERLPEMRLYYDLAALKGQSYHNGLVFSVYTPGSGRSVASGGRYDDIGIAFGRGRPATGFSLDLRMLSRIAANKAAGDTRRTICAPHAADNALLDMVRQLRAQGNRVVFCYDEQLPEGDSGSIARLVKIDGNWVVD